MIIKIPMLLESTLRHTQKMLEPHGVKIAVHEQPLEGERFPCRLLHLPEGTRREKISLPGLTTNTIKLRCLTGLSSFKRLTPRGGVSSVIL
jgi:hypothetical protein